VPTDIRPRTLVEAFQANVHNYSDRVALRTPGDTVRITFGEYDRRVRRIAAGLTELGVRPADTVALMLTNRPEFHLCDTAILHLGATPFSMYNTNPPEMLAHLFENGGNRIVICEQQFVPQIRAAMDIAGKVEHVICVDGEAEGTVTLDRVETTATADFDFDAAWRSVRSDDVLTIVYTSGTTGLPKGVELTHANFMANSAVFEEFGSFGPDDRVVSYLPDAHAANRWLAHYANLLFGVQVTTLGDSTQVLQALTEVRPTVFMGVPRIWIKLKAALEAAVAEDASRLRRRLGGWALRIGEQSTRRQINGAPASPALRIQQSIADRLVLSRIRQRLGLNDIRLGLTGAAPIPPDVHYFMLGLGLTICEAWGLTETSAVATVNRPGAIKVGTVGQVVPGGELALADDGELLVRGDLVMRGYRHDPEKTAEAVDSDGWLRTGDIGTIDDEGFVTIVDRKKELIINASGKNMSPTHIENTIAAACPLAGPVAAIGDNRPYVIALVTLDQTAVTPFAQRNNLDKTKVADLYKHPLIEASVESAVAQANTKLSRVEQIKRYAILPVTWEPGGDEITPTMKLKRKVITSKYANEIETLYNPG
jgi:long-chain acyl-CoA synthetase